MRLKLEKKTRERIEWKIIHKRAIEDARKVLERTWVQLRSCLVSFDEV